MKRSSNVVAMFVAAAFVAGTAVGAKADASVGWKGSTYVKDSDAGYSIKFGGRIMNDWVFNWPSDELSDAHSVSDGVKFRRVRLYSSGTIYHAVEYKLQLDFGGGDADFKDVWLGVKTSAGKFRLGHQYEPAGLETLTSSKVITFIERASVTALMPERKSGATYSNHVKSGDVTVAAGLFVPSDSYGDFTSDSDGNDYAFTGRVTSRPWVEDEGNHFVHVGVSGSFRDPMGKEYSLKVKPDNPIAPSLISTGTQYVDNVTLVGAEAALVYGPASVQGEFALSSAKALDDSVATGAMMGDVKVTAMYVQAAYTITGETRGYKGGLMEGIHPESNFDGTGGKGALEVAGRFAVTDASDDNLMAGKLTTMTFGLNWYLNPYTRVMVNFVRADLDYPDTMDLTMNSILTRFQVSF